MNHSTASNATEIWNAGIAAVDGRKVAADAIQLDATTLMVGGHRFELANLRHIKVIGFGKCSGAMATGVEHALRDLPEEISLSGLVTIPDGQTDITQHIELKVCRDRASNFPTETVVQQTQTMLEMLSGSCDKTLVIALVSGGGSALLEIPQVPLEDLVAISKTLSHAGAPIESLNTVRRSLSKIKAGGLARHVLENSSATMIGLVISDVIGDSLAMVSSGPTILDDQTSAQRKTAASKVLKHYVQLSKISVPQSVADYLQQNASDGKADEALLTGDSASPRIKNVLLANNNTAVEAAKAHARQIGYTVLDAFLDVNRDVEEVADQWLALAKQMLNEATINEATLTSGPTEPIAIIAGGEPTVKLCDAPGQGGRNLQLAALVLQRIAQLAPQAASRVSDLPLAFLSGGSDGEDGTSPMAGGYFDSQTLKLLKTDADLMRELDSAIKRNDCHTWFGKLKNHLHPPTVSTNICDLQVLLIG